MVMTRIVITIYVSFVNGWICHILLINHAKVEKSVKSHLNFSCNASSTTFGTSAEMFPPYFDTSFTILELKNEY